MGSQRPSLDYCRRVQARLEPFASIDDYYNEKRFMEMALEKGLERNVKLPDCGWHHSACSYVVVELKGVNFIRALRQLENFADIFPEIHAKVARYIVRVRTAKQLRGYRCEQVGILCRPYVRLARGRVKKYIEVRGKPIYVIIGARF